MAVGQWQFCTDLLQRVSQSVPGQLWLHMKLTTTSADVVWMSNWFNVKHVSYFLLFLSVTWLWLRATTIVVKQYFLMCFLSQSETSFLVCLVTNESFRHQPTNQPTCGPRIELPVGRSQLAAWPCGQSMIVGSIARKNSHMAAFSTENVTLCMEKDMFIFSVKVENSS